MPKKVYPKESARFSYLWKCFNKEDDRRSYYCEVCKKIKGFKTKHHLKNHFKSKKHKLNCEKELNPQKLQP